MSNDRYITLSFLIAAVLIGAVMRSFGIEVIAALAWPDPLLMGLLNATSVLGIVTGIVSFFVLLRHADHSYGLGRYFALRFRPF